MKRIAFAIVIAMGCILSFSQSAMAACSSSGCTGKIVRLYISGNYLFIGTDGDERSLNCTSPASTYVSIPTTDSMFDQKYAMLLTASSLDNVVGIRVIEGSSMCEVAYVYMNN